MKRPPRRPLLPRAPEPDPGASESDERSPWLDATHEDADLANQQLRGDEVRRCTFTRCRLTGLQLPEGALTDVRFVDCRIDLASLRWASLERVHFQGCVLRELDLVEAKLQDVLFEDCDLRLADLSGMRGSRVELRGCDVEGLGGVDGLRGALVRWPDALGLLGPLVAGAGLVVLEEEEPPLGTRGASAS